MYEYKVIECYAKNVESKMNEYAKDGWRVISTCFYSQWRNVILVTFEREK